VVVKLLTGVSALIRFDDWWYSKIGAAMGIGMWLVLAHPIPFASALPKLVFGIIAVSCLGAFGYAINDIADRDIDRKSAKVRLIASLPVGQTFVLIGSSVAGGLLACLPLGTGAALLLSAGYAVAAIYSLPPIRLKERRLAGVFAGAIAQRSIPAALLLLLFDPGRFFGSILLLWSTLVGMRWLLVHQILDERSDRVAGVTTFVTAEGAGRSRKLLDRVVFPAELSSFVALIVVSLRVAPWLALAFLPAAFTWPLMKARRRSEGISFATLGLADVYETWWPLALAVTLSARDPRFALFAVAHVLMFWKIFKWRLSLFAAACRRIGFMPPSVVDDE
jgi:4-hydroxybenzoate polyprenyltransferase